MQSFFSSAISLASGKVAEILHLTEKAFSGNKSGRDRYSLPNNILPGTRYGIHIPRL